MAYLLQWVFLATAISEIIQISVFFDLKQQNWLEVERAYILEPGPSPSLDFIWIYKL